MSELQDALVGESYAAPPSHILEGLSHRQATQQTPNTPHSIYAELWHLVFWQQLTLDWVDGLETPYPVRPDDGFPSPQAVADESFADLRIRFLNSAKTAAGHASDSSRLDEPIRCPSRPGHPIRIMSVRDQLISLAAHNAYHLGRILLLRQLQQTWPPESGGFIW